MTDHVVDSSKMKRAFFILFLLFVSTLDFGFGSSTNEWTGFWRLKQSSPLKQVETLYYLWISAEGRLHLYNDAWIEERLRSVDSKIDGETLILSQFFRGGQLVWSGKREGESLKGKWEFRHIQVPLEDKFSGTRISLVSRKDWHPLKAANAKSSAEGILNLDQIVEDHMADEEHSEEYWTNMFMPDYLAFLPKSSEKFTASRDLIVRRDRETSKGVEKLVADFIKRLNKNYPSFNPIFSFAITPFGSAFTQEFISGKPYLLINPIEFVNGMNLDSDKIKLCHNLVASILAPYSKTKYHDSFSGGMIKIGLELFLLDQAFPNRRPEVLEITSERLENLGKKLPELKKVLQQKNARELIKADAKRYLSLIMIQELLTVNSFDMLWKGTVFDLAKAFSSFSGVDEEANNLLPGRRSSKKKKRRSTN